MPAVDPNSLVTQTFEWGSIKWLVSPASQPEAGLTLGEVVLLPGKAHDRHNHPESEEVLYVLSGEGEQMVDDGEPFAVAAGSTIYVPTGVYHSTRNTSWQPMRLLALYNPAGAEQALQGLPDFREEPAGTIPGWSRA
jgi:oxalate decarboxylase/phosphoglucose isomerase-like protein (cupin superfamily)